MYISQDKYIFVLIPNVFFSRFIVYFSANLDTLKIVEIRKFIAKICFKTNKNQLVRMLNFVFGLQF